MRVVCSIPKSTNTHSEYVILIAFPLPHCTNAPKYYVIRKLLVLLTFAHSNLIREFFRAHELKASHGLCESSKL